MGFVTRNIPEKLMVFVHFVPNQGSTISTNRYHGFSINPKKARLLKPSVIQGFSHFSRMRSEGFPFIVGVWGWTCVRVVFVASSSPTPRRVVNFSPMGGTHTMRHNHVLQKMKSGGSLARNAHFGTSKSPDGRSFSCFAWQARYFRGVSISARHFGVAGAALCNVAVCICVAGAAF